MTKSMENKRFDACGSSLMDRITEYGYDQLVQSFGEPTIAWDVESPDGKTRVEWNLTFDLEDDSTVHATIYDYKSDELLSQNKVWSIGGYNDFAARCVNAVLFLDHEFKKVLYNSPKV